MIRIRTMTHDDLPLGLSLTEHAGWNQTEADWRRFLSLSAHGCFVGEIDGRPLGSVATFTFGGIGWIAMVLVHPDARGRGLGHALTEHALRHLERRGVLTIRLDATALGQPIYEKLGFVSQYQVHRYQGAISQLPAATPDAPLIPPTASPLRPDHLVALCAFDRSITATDRRPLLEHLYREIPCELRAVHAGSRLAGYVTMRPGRHAWQIGPAVAEDEATGCALLDAAVACHAGQPIFIDIPADNASAHHWARQRGLAVQRALLRMARGKPVLDQPSKLWASSGPEKG